MSGLLLSKHWRFNMPMLMGHLKKGASGHLLRNTAHHLVKACRACSCTVPAGGYPACGCQTADYSAFLTRGSATFTVSGSTTPNALIGGGGTCGASYTGSTGPSVAGTYAISCGTLNQCYWHAVPIGCIGTSTAYWYYVAGIKLSYPAIGDISVILYHQQYVEYAGVNPFPTVTGPTSCGPLLTSGTWTRTIQWGPTHSYSQWLYEIGGTCDASCNTPITGAPDCLSGAQSPSIDVNSGSPNPCGSVTVSLDLAAAT